MQIIAAHAKLPEGALVWHNTVDPLQHADEVRQARVIVLAFPKWTDGRAYSQAVLLRARLRFGREIRATGEVLVDMLPLLRRCGFDAAQLQAGQSLDAATRSVLDFPGHYQRDASGAACRHANAHAPSP